MATTTWETRAGMTGVVDTTNIDDFAEQAEASKNAAAASATSAAQSATNSANSATTSQNQVSLAVAQVGLATTQATASASSASASAASAVTSGNAETAAVVAKNSAETAQAAAVAAQTASETAKNTSVASAATSTSKASESAASAAAAAISETNANTSANTASTQASNSATSATASETSRVASVAAQAASEAAQTAAETAQTAAETAKTGSETAETNAATSAATAATQAGISTTKAGEAVSSATAASGSATAAAGSASAASTSASDAAAALDEFTDLYLGSKGSDPTLDNDGNALQTGALYHNNSDDLIKFYNGSAWVAAYATLSGALIGTNNLSDVANVSAARTNLGLGTAQSPSFNNVTVQQDPTTSLQLATKQYVDTIAAAGLHYHAPVRVEAPSALTVTYNNGSSGVGATLTNAGTQAALAIDGITLQAADRVLIYAQADATQNGIYTVTNVGSASTNWVLTRSTDTDSYAPSDPDSFGEGDAFFVLEGNTGAGELYVMNTSGAITFGTTNITFTQVASTAVYTADGGLDLTGTVFSHADTSSQATVNNSGGTVIQDVTLDTYGHVTGLTSHALTAANVGAATSAQGALADSAVQPNDAPTFGTTTVNGNIVVSGTVDGRDVAADGSKLDGIEASAKDDQTITAGSGLSGGGTGNVTLSHADTSSVLSSDNSGNTFIQDLTFDTYGHVTAVGTGSVSIGNGTLTVQGTGALGGSGTFTANQSTNATISISHDDTSSQVSVDNSGATVIQDVTLDGYGHVTALGSHTLTLANLGYTGATNANYITNNNQLTNGAGYITSYVNTTYSADGNYGLTLSGTTFRLENDRRRNATGEDVWSGNTHDYTFYDADVGIRWYTAGVEDMRLDNSGNLHVDGNVTAYSTTISDERLKKDIVKIDSALDKVDQINGYTFTYITDGKKSAGVIAQEVEKVLPSAITESTLPLKMGEDDKTEYKTVQYDQLIGLLVEAVKELKAEVAELKGK